MKETSSPLTLPGEGPSARLSGNLGVTEIIFMVVAAAAPLTVISGNVPLAIAQGNGAQAWTGFVAAAIVLLLFSVGFVTMAPYMKDAGAFFSYIRAGLGGRVGRGSAFLALLTYTAIQLGVYGFFGWAVDDTVRQWGGPHLPWWGYAGGALALVAFLGYRHIDLSSRLLGTALVLEIGVVLVMNAAILIHPSPVMPPPSATPPVTGPFAVALLFAITGFIGFEATAIFRDEARDPERTIPRATYGAVIIIGVFYAFSCWCIIMAWGPDAVTGVAQRYLADGGNMVLETAGRYAGNVVKQIMAVLLLTSLFACVLSFHNIIARYQLVLGREGVLPSFLARTHDHHESPHAASVVQTLTALVLMVLAALSGADPLVTVYGSMAGISTVGIVLLMILTSCAVVAFFRARPTLVKERKFKTALLPMLTTFLMALVLFVILENFTTITGLSLVISTCLGALPFVALGLGMCRDMSVEGILEEGVAVRS
ncbi:amino acid transporter [Acetobacter estunensis NRIC 0472]|uniref:Amino acid permease n=1 Tax=Acetobacter estunensis TaxID=104097 RepID=A0A967BA08_9PROT|nr:APC family permease [Acetobacter estunensis]NHO53178.1 amino acid permease [Acetobacter estunensis]GBQ24943.1 amino acid transporter [Acetobacter estunensis NRIC 0472]